MADSDLKQSPFLVKVMDIVNTITNLAIGGAAMGGIAAAAVLGSNTDITTHMSLVIVGYVLIMSQAVMSMNPTSGWARAFRYEHKQNIHLGMQVVGAILAIAGSAYAMSFRNRYNLPRTTHGIMGIVTLVFTLITLIGGLVHAFARNLVPANMMKIGHAVFGSLTMLFVFVTYSLGLEKIYSGSDAFAVYITLIVISILGILAPPVTNVLRRIMN